MRVTLKIAGVWVVITETLVILDIWYEITAPGGISLPPHFSFEDYLIYDHVMGYTFSAMFVLPIMMVAIEIWRRLRPKQT